MSCVSMASMHFWLLRQIDAPRSFGPFWSFLFKLGKGIISLMAALLIASFVKKSRMSQGSIRSLIVWSSFVRWSGIVGENWFVDDLWNRLWHERLRVNIDFAIYSWNAKLELERKWNKLNLNSRGATLRYAS